MKKSLPQCFLGKRVSLDNNKHYTIKYQDNRNKDGIHVLLFDNEKPVIFAVMNNEGGFLHSFFLSKQSNTSSLKALNKYSNIAERKASHKLSQDDLKDALRSKEDAKMKNENLFKMLVDEHLEDIKNGWSSRLLFLQNTEYKCDNSLIIESLKEALTLANPHKSFYFLTLHRYDKLLPYLVNHLPQNTQLLQTVVSHYEQSGDNLHLFSFLKKAAKLLPIDYTSTIKSLISLSYSYDIDNSTHYFKPIFLILYKRVKLSDQVDTKQWLSDISSEPIIKQAIKSLKR